MMIDLERESEIRRESDSVLIDHIGHTKCKLRGGGNQY